MNMIHKIFFIYILFFFPFFLFAQNTDKIIKKFYKTCGSEEDWKKINAMKVRVVSTLEANDIHDVVRIEGILYSYGRNMFFSKKIESPVPNTLFDGKMAYFIYKDSTYKRDLLIEQVANTHPSIFSVEVFFGKRFCDFSKNINKITYVKDTSYQNQNNHVLLLKENNSNIYVYMNGKTGLVDFFRNETSFVAFSNYKKIGKVLIPHTKNSYIIEEEGMKKNSQEDILSIELNPKFPFELFTLEYHTKKK